MSFRNLGYAALLALFGYGCSSSTGMGGPRVLKAGQQEVGVGLELSLNQANFSEGQDAPAPWPQLTASYRLGLGADLELGARMWGFGLANYFFTWGSGIDMKYGILQSPSVDEGFDLSLGLGATYHQINYLKAPNHVVTMQVPLLFGVNIGAANQIYFGPRFEYQTSFGESQNTVRSAFGGATIGFVWRALSYIEIRPEVVVLYSPVPFNGTAEDGKRGLLIGQVGFSSAIFFDRM